MTSSQQRIYGAWADRLEVRLIWTAATPYKSAESGSGLNGTTRGNEFPEVKADRVRDGGLIAVAHTAQVSSDLRRCQNEPIFGRIPLRFFHIEELLNLAGLIKFGRFPLFTLSLKALKLRESAVVIANDAGGVAAEALQVLALLHVNQRGGENRVHLGLIGFNPIAEIVMSNGIGGALASVGPVQAPLLVRESLDEMLFRGPHRMPIFGELMAVLLIKPQVFFRKYDNLAGEAVAKRVEAGALFALRSAGACG